MTATTDEELERLGAATYVSLTTFRRDGRAVATPVWASREADALWVWTEAGSGKVKRLHHDSRVLLAPCDARGRLQGAHVEGTARVSSAPEDLERVTRLHAAKYRLAFHAWRTLGRLVRGLPEYVAVEITLP
ncbi:MAG: PPOX class F420-dependent oxidoreductase [Frankiales bacterium]|nr:PPOX class F420-dependent oxidoreductase [Frankiales bacterium]